MWFLLLLFISHIETVFLQGDANRLILKNGNNPCEGHIEIFHNNTWGYVGDTEWSRNTEVVVCRSTHCGEHVSTENVLRPIHSKVWLDDIICNGNESHLWDCTHPGWDNRVYREDAVKSIKCSNEIKISLDGFECAGAVKYSTDGETPSGYFCADNWGPNEADLLCRSLGCGTSQEILLQNLMVWREFESSAKMTIECSGIENLDNLWQCATTQESGSCSNPASVRCSGHKRMQLKGSTANVCQGQLEVEEYGNWSPLKKSNTISPDRWCQQMFCGTNASHWLDDNGMHLNCTGNVTVALMDKNKPSKCYGAVYVMVNTSRHPVCASNWTKEDAELVCRELNCGELVSKTTIWSNIQDGILDNVNCSGKESSLWYCRAKRDNKPLSCSSQAYVVCSDSIDVRLVDGLGKCAGRVEVQYEGRWQRVGKTGWTDTNSDVVCKQLKCGKKRKSPSSDKFNQGSGNFLTKAVKCQSRASHISECVEDFSNTPTEEKFVITIICEEHKVVFLKGDKSCSGTVGIEHGGKTYWLSGSIKTWNKQSANSVCRQMHCGEASVFESIPGANMTTNVWCGSYNCSSNTTSLFDCETKTLPSDHCDTIATVNCSGNINVSLTNTCWGNVNVCVGGDCGGVCKDTWTEQKSSMLCKNLDCGIAINASKSNEKSEVIIKSLHVTKHTTNLNQSNLVLNVEKDTSCNQKPAYVVCSGSVKTKFNASRYKCSGNVEMYYEGQWLPVCLDALQDIVTQKTICGEEKCGQVVKTVQHFGPKTAGLRAVSQIQCPVNGNDSLKACNMTSHRRGCALGGLRCSSWRKMELKFNKAACSGAVFVHSEGSRDAVSAEGWTEAEGNRLCQDLKCGNFKSNTTTKYNSFWNGSFSCEGVEDPKNIWACEKPALPSLKQHLNIECQDEPEISLSQTCFGEVRMNNISVCSSHWNMTYSDMVCHEKGCFRAISFEVKPPNPDVRYHHVSCEDYHYKLGQCNRYKAKCNGGLVSVYCGGNVDFRTKENVGDRNKTTETPGLTMTPVVSITLGVGLPLVLVMMILLFICIKRAIKVSSRMLSRVEVESESGNHDVISRANDIEDLSHHTLRSEAKVIMEPDVQNSSSYDDIDEAVEAQPLTSQAATAAASREDHFHEGETIYEVNDPEENYDDIDSWPEITQTQAEIHPSTCT